MTRRNNRVKAKLRRLCEKKKNGRLNVPVWLHDAWRSGDHLEMANQFEKVGFDKELRVLCWFESLRSYQQHYLDSTVLC